MFLPYFLEAFGSPPNLKVRVYLYRGLNLAAQSDNVEIGNRLAGLSALCSADTYPSFKIGQGDSGGFDLTKIIEDKANVVKQTLDPGYFRSYELDATFPNDWKLVISIMNSGFMDNMIGASAIDLEDRFYGNMINKQRLAYDIYLKYFDKEIQRLLTSGGMLKNGKEISSLKERKNIVVMETESLDRNIVSLVEYRSLQLPGKVISQGSLEMALDVLSADIGKRIYN